MTAALFGRDYEIAQISAALARTKAEKVPATIRLLGPSGIGKSALLEASCTLAKTDGWLAGSSRCHEIESKLPLAGAQRLAHSLLDALGPARERYAADALERVLRESREGFDEAFLRLIEGVSLDFAVLLTVDDVQWLDAESSTLIESSLRAFSTRTIAILAAERTAMGQLSGSFASGSSLRVEKLPLAAAADVVRAHYPQARASVVNAIVTQSMAHPIDLVTLARAAKENAVDDPLALVASLRIVLARQLDTMAPSQREFLQICALISEPISYHILAKIWPDETQLLAKIEQASGRYLVQEGDGLRFAHIAIADSIRQTMPIEIPYRRRILNALLSIERPTLSDYAAVVSQAAACGDADLEYGYLLKLGDAASGARAFLIASDAYERALVLRAPVPDKLIAFYRSYALALANQARMKESATILRRALNEAVLQRLPSAVGILGTQLIASVASTEGARAAHETYEHYLGQTDDEHDRMLLHSIGSWSYVCRAAVERFDALKEQVLGADGGVPAEASVRLFGCESLLRSRMGEYARALHSLERADLLADGVSPSQRMTTEYGRAFVDFFQFGLNSANAPTHREGAGDPLDPMRVMALLSAGDWDDARGFITDSIARGRRTTARAQVLAADAAIAVFTQSDAPYSKEIREELRGFEAGDINDLAVPLGGWWAASLAAHDKREAATLLDRVREAVAFALSPFALFVPLSMVIAAYRLADQNALQRLSEMREVWCDRNPWNVAHRDLAIGVAQALLKSPQHGERLEIAARAFEQLGAPFFAAYARASSRSSAGASDLLAALGVTVVTVAPTTAARKGAAVAGIVARPTARERQVVALVAAGNSNREIAEQLVLSERTVEAHLANVFNKLGVSSRTQLVAWHYSA